MNCIRHLASLVALPFLTAALQAQESPSYAKDVRPFLGKYCLECHNQKNLKGKLNLETYQGLMRGSSSGEVVVPGKADESILVLLVEGKDNQKMPPKEARLQPKAKEIGVLRAWVAAGAKDDSADFKITLPNIKPTVAIAPPVTALAYRFDDKALAVAGNREVLVLDPTTGAIINGVYKLNGNVTALAYKPGSDYLAVAYGVQGVRGLVGYHRIQNSNVIASGHLHDFDGHSDIILDLAFRPDGKNLATCSYDRTVKLWDTASGKLLHTLKEHSDAVYGVAFHKSGKLLATVAADRAVKVWDADMGKLLYTLSEATDWVYCVSWSPDGKHLAAAGVDRSIRVWEATDTGGKLIHSVFAHEAPIIRLIYSADGKTLYSLGEDRIVKAWDVAKMTERKVYAKQPENVLALAVRHDRQQLALGRYDGALLLVNEPTGEVQKHPLPVKPPPAARFPLIDEVEPNNSPGTGQAVKLPASIAGKLQQTGDVDWFRFEVEAGQQVGVQMLTKEIGSKVDAYLELVDAAGKVLARSNDGFLGHTFAKAGTYALGVRDREFKGGIDMGYRLDIGPIPIITSVYPLGIQKDTTATIQLDGVFLDKKEVEVTAVGAPVGTKLPIILKTPSGTPLGKFSILVDEFPDVLAGKSNLLPIPGTGNGIIAQPGITDVWRFQAKKGQKLILEVNARRLGSPLDSFIEILDAKGKPVARAMLRSLAKTYITFRDHDSAGANIRIEAWGELAVNDWILVGNELMKIKALPTHPDADCTFFSERGQRIGFLDTTPTHHALGTPMYKVAIHPPGTQFSPNGFPVITLYYRNDDGGPGYGRDSRLFFEAPADGEYQVRIGDSRGQGGPHFAYRLTVRPPRPSFNISVSPQSPVVWKGGAIPMTVTADRLDGFSGAIQVKLENLPPGFSAPQTTIPAGENSTAFALYAEATATQPASSLKLKLTAYATIDGQKVIKEVTGGAAMLQKGSGDIVTATEQAEITLKSGSTVKLTVKVDRKNGFAGRIPLDVRGLPHGVRVLDIGLNGILITESETVRTIVIYAEPWVEPMDHPIVVLASREGKNTQHAAKSVLLKIVK
jgi:WD40 repeat protein